MLEQIWIILIKTILIAIPIYVSNLSPVVLGGKLRIDFGKKFFDDRDIFGKGKTWQGLLGGILAGTMVGWLIAFFLPQYTLILTNNYYLAAFALSTAGLLGDLIKSFFKRRINIESGKEWFPWDRIDFVIGAFVFTFPLISFSLFEIILLLSCTLVLHKISNEVAYNLKLKKVPW